MAASADSGETLKDHAGASYHFAVPARPSSALPRFDHT